MQKRRHLVPRGRSRLFATALLVVALTSSLGIPALAAPGFLIDIPINTVETGDEDSEILLATAQVPAEFQGQTCATISTANNSSVHPLNDLLVRSGTSESRLANVESAEGLVIVQGLGDLVLGPVITVTLEMGPDEFFSAGIVVTVDCEGDLSGYACIDGSVVFIEDATGFEGTLYATEAEALNDPACSEVLTTTTFTIGGACAVTGDEASFTISGSFGEGVSLTLDGNPVGTSPFSVDVGGPGSYAYSVTLDDGFVLAEGSPAAVGSVVVVDCTVPPPPSGWVCEAGEAVFLADTTGFVGTVYGSQAEALEDPECQSVLAATTFTIGGVCTLVGDVASFRISGSLGEGLTLTVAGQTVTTSPFSVAVGSAGSYSYSVALDEGFELAAGSPAAAGTILIQDCSSDTEIDEVDELPFTGIDAGALAVASMALLGTGAMMLMSSRRREES